MSHCHAHHRNLKFVIYFCMEQLESYLFGYFFIRNWCNFTMCSSM
uniref:Uncharacterized protein n=1 Tax=Picea sitchensis TaxID=3332 RepID=D5AAY2_PICSI|nr:unknown [Picea sitchensis]